MRRTVIYTIWAAVAVLLQATAAAGRSGIAPYQARSAVERRPYQATPEALGVSSKGVAAWLDACGERLQYLHGFVLMRHGQVVAEGSWAPYDTLNETHALYSHSKSFTSTAIGFLVDDGKVDLDERVIDILPDKAPPKPSPNLCALRVRDLLTMNVGAKRGDAERDDAFGDWERAFLANTIDLKPGTKFRYDSGATYMLAAIVERKSGKRLMDFLSERLFRPLGIAKAWSTASPSGTPCGGWGMNMTTRELAAFGQLYLQNGVWKGRRLLSSEWIALATARQTWSGAIAVADEKGNDWQQGYGFQFWRCRHGFYRADGANGQLTIVMPQYDAVMSVHAGLGDMQAELDLIWAHIVPAMSQAPIKDDPEAASALARKIAALSIAPAKGGREGDAAFVGRTFRFAPNGHGVSSIRLDRHGKGWMADIVTAAGRQRFPVGCGAWARGEIVFDSGSCDTLGSIIGKRPLAASAGVGDDGVLRLRTLLLNGPHRLDLDFRATPQGATASGRLSGIGGCEIKAAAPTDEGCPKAVSVRVRQTAGGPQIFVDGSPVRPRFYYGSPSCLCNISWVNPGTYTIPFRAERDTAKGRIAIDAIDERDTMWFSKAVLVDETLGVTNAVGRAGEWKTLHYAVDGLRFKAGHFYNFIVTHRAARFRTYFTSEVSFADEAGAKRVLPLPYGDTLGDTTALAAETGVDLVTFSTDTSWGCEGWWAPPGEPDSYGKIDRWCEALIARNPRVLLVPRVKADAPDWMLRRHPEMKMRFVSGTVIEMSSVSSRPYRQAAVAAVERLTRHLREKFPRNFAGLHVSGQNSAEWFYMMSQSNDLSGYDVATRDAFRAWLAAHGEKDAATAEVPTAAERKRAEKNRLRDGAKDRRVIDFHRFRQEEIATFLADIGGAVRRGSDGQVLALFFYGYAWELGNVQAGAAETGHYAVEWLVRNAKDRVDGFSAPISYSNRRWPGTTPVMSAAESIMRAGFLWINENDYRTHHEAIWDHTAELPHDDPWMTRETFLRTSVSQILRGYGDWWMDLFGRGWFRDRAVWDVRRLLNPLDEAMAKRAKPYSPEIAVCVNEESFLYLGWGCGPNLSRRGFEACGVTYGQYYLNDVLANPPEAKVFYLVVANNLRPEQKAALAALKKARPDAILVENVTARDVSAEAIAAVAEKAGAHCYAPPGRATVNAAENFVSVSALAEGPLTLNFGDAEVSDFLTGARLGNGPRITLPFRQGETRVFRVKPASFGPLSPSARPSDRQYLWPEGKMPYADKNLGEPRTRPYIDWYAPAATCRTDLCVMTVSGGGFMSCCDAARLQPAIDRLVAAGITVADVTYRTPRPKGLPIHTWGWADVQRAVRVVKSEAAKRGFSPKKVGATGISAGAKAVLLVATSSLTPAYAPVDAIDRIPANLLFAMPQAPAYVLSDGTGGENTRMGEGPDITLVPELKFDEKTCPMCFFQGGTDAISPLGSTALCRRLHKMMVPCELHLFADRWHGFHGDMNKGDDGEAHDHWFGRALEYIRQWNYDGRRENEVAILSRFADDFARASCERENVWPEGLTPSFDAAQDAPYLEWHIPKTLRTKAIQIVYSGGSYERNSPDGGEVAPVRRYLNAKGMTVVTLKYRTPRPRDGSAKHVSAWQDLQRAIRLVRNAAPRRNLDPDRIGIMGFSAGGHLTLMGATTSKTRAYRPVDAIDRLSCRVQWAVAVFPAYVLDDNGHLAPEFAFDLDTPPVLFLHGDADSGQSSVLGSVAAWEQLRRMGIQGDLHTFATRGHGFQGKASPGTGSFTYLDRVWEFMNHTRCNR